MPSRRVVAPAWYPSSSPAADGTRRAASFNTRWSSATADHQWLLVDLGATHTIAHVVLAWESAYAKAFQIQVSSDAVNLTTIYSTTTGTGGTQRATGYGYSLWEFQVFGT